MGVICRVDLPLLRERADSLELFDVLRQFERGVRAAERFGNVEDVLEFFVRHVRVQALPCIDLHACVVVHFAQRFVLVHRYGCPPLLQLVRGRALSGLLLGCRLLTASSATTTATTAPGWSAGEILGWAVH